ncbi:hypothetical protein DFJ73DRAFT_809303 [Zopfochytrium polystomum]|nr:hypothetical protein DFJ73DRAFT_809303 [Zopfochytrium polystomum]
MHTKSPNSKNKLDELITSEFGSMGLLPNISPVGIEVANLLPLYSRWQVSDDIWLRSFPNQQYPTLDEVTARSAASSARVEEPLALRYLYLYSDAHGFTGEMERHCFARYCDSSETRLSPVVDDLDRCRFPRLREVFDRSPPAARFIHTQVQMKLPITAGECKNILVLEADSYRTLECTTTVYSCGQRILETQELRYPVVAGDGCRYMYHFDFVGRFFDAFLSSCLNLPTLLEAQAALHTLSIQQVFDDVDTDNGPATVLCIAYTFTTGKGSIEILPLLPTSELPLY